MSDATFSECEQYFDMVDDCLTFKGFLQVCRTVEQASILWRLSCTDPLTLFPLYSALSTSGTSFPNQATPPFPFSVH